MSNELQLAFPQARIGPNGELLFPHRGDPPKPIQGYIRVEGEPFVFKPIMGKCKFRGIVWNRVCGGIIQKINCTHFGKNVRILDCVDCLERIE